MQTQQDVKQKSAQAAIAEKQLSAQLDQSIDVLRDVFFNDDTIVFQVYKSKGIDSFCIVYVDGLVSHDIVNKNILNPILSLENPVMGGAIHALMEGILRVDQIQQTADIMTLVEGIVNGDTVLLVNGEANGLVLSSKQWTIRAVSEPLTETITRGPREGFTESLMVNLGMIRRKFKTSDLKFKIKKLGSRTKTPVCLVYLDEVVNQQILQELVKRLEDYNLDATLGAGYVEEYLLDTRYTPFHTIGTTERPDTVAGKLLEGRIAIFIDGTPVALTLPFLFMEMFQVDEDYYNNYIYASMLRMLRFLGFVLTLLVPAIYIAIIGYHQEFLPTNLLLSIVASRVNVPFPSVLEVIALMTVFEILREAGTRMPSNVGQALSIVGALVLGQAAVEAKIVSAVVIIIVGFVGITSMLVYKATGAMMILRIALLLGATVMGMYGVMMALIGIMIHLFKLRSFGVPYMLNVSSTDFQQIKDCVIRSPWYAMDTRPKFLTQNRRRKGA